MRVEAHVHSYVRACEAACICLACCQGRNHMYVRVQMCTSMARSCRNRHMYISTSCACRGTSMLVCAHAHVSWYAFKGLCRYTTRNTQALAAQNKCNIDHCGMLSNAQKARKHDKTRSYGTPDETLAIEGARRCVYATRLRSTSARFDTTEL